MEKKVLSTINGLTVEEFLEMYSESIQDKMSVIGYYIYID